MLSTHFIKRYTDQCLQEDGFWQNFLYVNSLPNEKVTCSLKIKSDLVLVGLPVFFECFQAYCDTKLDFSKALEFEGKEFKESDKFIINFDLPFSLALTMERIALNLLMRMSSIATTTRMFRSKIKNDIALLDTRKTTPGIRAFEKYAVNLGGGNNHRFSQTDAWMIKDNHKSFFGGLENAIDYFKNMKAFYNSLIVEIHDFEELKKAIDLNVQHVMLDNFSPEEVDEAIKIKPESMTYEVSGGINLETVSLYDKKGLDAISIGMLTYSPKKVDLSLKYGKKNV